MLSKRIAWLRKSAGMSQAKLSARLGISPSALGMYEQGRRVPALDVLVAMSEVFCVSLDYLITGADHAGKAALDDTRYWNCPCFCLWRQP